MAINDKNIGALAGILSGVAAQQAAQPVEREKSQYWANFQVKLPYMDPATNTQTEGWFTAFGVALDNLKEREIQGQPRTPESQMYHYMVAVQNHYTTHGKAMAQALKPGEVKVVHEEGNLRIVVQRAAEKAAAALPGANGIQLPKLVA